MSLSKPTPVRPDRMLPATVGDPTYYLPKVEHGRLTGILLRRGWLVLVLTALGMAAMVWMASGKPKMFRSSGSVYVSTQAPRILDIQAVSPEESRDLEQMRSVEQGLSATTLLARVVEKNGLSEDPAFAIPGEGQEALLRRFSERVEIGLRRGTRIIDLAVEDTDPARAKRLVESLVSEYEAWTTERQQAITRQASDGLAREEERLKGKMELSARRLQEFRENNPVPGLDGGENPGVVRDQMAVLGDQLAKAKGERLRLESEYEALRTFDAEDPRALAGLERTERGTEVLSQVRAIQLKEADFVRVKERYLHKHPVYQEMEKEIARMRSDLADTVKDARVALEQRYKIARENETKLAEEVAAARVEAVDVEGLRQDFQVLRREAEADRRLYESVAMRLRETTLASSVPASVLRWEDTPMVPEKPHGPRTLVMAAIGAIGGFFCGLLLLTGLEISDGKVRDAAAAGRATGLPLLANVPKAEVVDDAMLLLSQPASPASEAFRRLGAALAPAAGNATARTVLFASAKAGEGRSFCALNHAVSLALQGHRTLLLDADLRAAGLSAAHLETGGLGGYMTGSVDAASACHTTALPNLYLLSSGPVRPDAAELLGGTRFPALLEDAFRWFDRVVVDTPPLLASSDTLAVARYADRVCLVVSDRGAERRELRRAAELLRASGGHLAGLVWNEVTPSAQGRRSASPIIQRVVTALPSPEHERSPEIRNGRLT